MRSTVLIALLCGLMTACQTAPTGSPGGRRDPYRTTEGDYRSPAAHAPSMLEFSDATVQKLALDLASIPEIAQSPTRAVLYLGTFENQTRRTPSSDFELITRRVRNQLVNMPVARNNFMILEDRQRMQKELERIYGPDGGDLLQEGTGSQTTTDAYDAAVVWVLQGDFFEMSRGGTARYYFNIQLAHPQSGQIVWNNDYLFGQER